MSEKPTVQGAIAICERIRAKRAEREAEETERVEKMKGRVRAAAAEAIAHYTRDGETTIKIVALLEREGLLNFTNFDQR